MDTANLILLNIVEGGLKLLHPMMPFLTEELYQKLPHTLTKAESITIASYPVANAEFISDELEGQFEDLFNVVKMIRSLSSSVNLPGNVKPKVFVLFVNPDPKQREIMSKNNQLIVALSKSSDVIKFRWFFSLFY